MVYKFNLILFFLIFIVITPFSDLDLFAAKTKPPNYKQALIILKRLWSEAYPLKVKRFIANPKKYGVLRAVYRGRYVYYYRFIAVVARRYYRKNGKIRTQGSRRIELWLRFRSRAKKPYDITFARKDLLPGKHKRRIRIR